MSEEPAAIGIYAVQSNGKRFCVSQSMGTQTRSNILSSFISHCTKHTDSDTSHGANNGIGRNKLASTTPCPRSMWNCRAYRRPVSRTDVHASILACVSRFNGSQRADRSLGDFKEDAEADGVFAARCRGASQGRLGMGDYRTGHAAEI